MLRDADETAAVKSGTKTINQAAKDATEKRKPHLPLATPEANGQEPQVIPQNITKSASTLPDPQGAAAMIRDWVTKSSPSYALGVRQTLVALALFHILDDETSKTLKDVLPDKDGE